MTASMTASAAVAARGLPSTPAEWLGAALVVAAVGLTLALGWRWVSRDIDRRFDAELARRARASAEFRARWPADQVWRAAYVELEAEIHRCWQLVLVLESRNSVRRGAAAAEHDRQIVAIRAWISTLLGPFNAAAAREHRVV